LPKLPKWARKFESKPNLLCPFQTEFPFFPKFRIPLRYVSRSAPRPKMPENFRAFRLLEMRDSEAAKNVEPAFHVLDDLEYGMEAVAQ